MLMSAPINALENEICDGMGGFNIAKAEYFRIPVTVTINDYLNSEKIFQVLCFCKLNMLSNQSLAIFIVPYIDKESVSEKPYELVGLLLPPDGKINLNIQKEDELVTKNSLSANSTAIYAVKKIGSEVFIADIIFEKNATDISNCVPNIVFINFIFNFQTRDILNYRQIDSGQ